MNKLTWKAIIDTHNTEKNAKRTIWRILGYGLRKKGRAGYTLQQLTFILEKNFAGFPLKDWSSAYEGLEKDGFIKTEMIGKRELVCLTDKGKELFDRKYSI